MNSSSAMISTSFTRFTTLLVSKCSVADAISWEERDLRSNCCWQLIMLQTWFSIFSSFLAKVQNLPPTPQNSEENQCCNATTNTNNAPKNFDSANKEEEKAKKLIKSSVSITIWLATCKVLITVCLVLNCSRTCTWQFAPKWHRHYRGKFLSSSRTGNQGKFSTPTRKLMEITRGQASSGEAYRES